MESGDNMRELGIQTRANIERIILRAGHVGISQSAIRNALRVGRSTVFLHCRALETEGRIEKTGESGRWVVWGAPGILAAHTKAKPPRKTSPQRWQDAKDAAHWADGWTEQMPAHLCVSANDVPPLGKPGIASVWELAA